MLSRSPTHSHPHPVVALAAALALGAAAGSAPAGTLLEATGGGWVSPDDGNIRLQMDVAHQTLPGGAQSASGSRELLHATSNGPTAYSSISGSAFADYGVLKARIDGLAMIFPQGTNIPNISDGTPSANGGFSARFMDSVTLFDPTLAIGAPVQYTFTVDIHVVSNGAGHTGPQFAGYDTGSFYLHYYMGSSVGRTYMFPNGLYTSIPSFSFSLPVTVDAFNGDVLVMGGELGLGADDRAGWYRDSGGFLTTYGTVTETHIDASNTIRFFLDPVTPNLQLISESGHNYATAAVPEPGTWALLAGGLVVLGWRGRHSLRAAATSPAAAP